MENSCVWLVLVIDLPNVEKQKNSHGWHSSKPSTKSLLVAQCSISHHDRGVSVSAATFAKQKMNIIYAPCWWIRVCIDKSNYPQRETFVMSRVWTWPRLARGAPLWIPLISMARPSQVRVGHSHSHPSWAVTSASSSPVIVQCMKSSALASDLNSLMDQLAHVLVITHNTFLSQMPCWPSIQLSGCPPAWAARLSVFLSVGQGLHHLTFDVRARLMEDLSGRALSLVPIRLQL